MKKSLFFVAAASALMLTACSSENDVVQNTTPQTTVQEKTVGFDVYTPAATNARRAGRANVMTTSIMQQTGFGVYAYQNDDTDFDYDYDPSVKPNFMWNQQVNYTKTSNGWYYSPLKYWPNETKNDSQTSSAQMPNLTGSNVDKLSFFAYAPWVQANSGTGAISIVNANMEADAASGITAITANDATTDPIVSYTVARDPDNSVDLLWGVAPVGGINYQNVAGKTTEVKEGMPLVGLVKPAVNTSLKFLFQHSLARIGVKVVAAVDQIAAGGNFDYANTKITIDKIEIKGQYGVEGTLNLKNTAANTPNWTITKTGIDSHRLIIDEGTGLAPHLVWNGSTSNQQTVTGVTTTVADAIIVRSKFDKDYSSDCATAEDGSTTALTYSATRPYFAAAADIKTPTYAAFNGFSTTVGTSYLQKYETNQGVTYTDISSTINTKYPTATVWDNIYTVSKNSICQVVASSPTSGQIALSTLQSDAPTVKAYRKLGNTYTATNQPVQLGDYVFYWGAEVAPASLAAPTYNSTYYKAKPNYFMVIPPTNPANKTIKVKITYYVSTTDANLNTGVVYTKNEVEKEITLPSFLSGKSYDLKLILGMTSVKLEAEVSDWTTTNVQVDLPQNTAE